MRGIVKKLISTLAAAALALTMMTLPRAPGNVAAAETSGNCAGDHSGMTEWTGGALSSGSYYLTDNVTLTDQITIGNGTDVTLCLNGNTITFTGSQSSDARIFSIEYGSLTLCDCEGTGKLTGGNVSGSGGAVSVNGGSFIMYGGEISGNKASGNSGNGGAVCLTQRGSFTMYGGTISNNTADNQGGAVYVTVRCEFTMSGGTIEKNKASFNGGGVYVGGSNVADGTFKMNGGTISGNESTANGGGVFVDIGGAFTMSGGTISGNKARTDGGGVCFSAGKFTIDGKVNISGNSKTGDSSANNVYLYRNKTITIGSGFDTSSTIGVNTHTAPTCSSPVAVTNDTTEEISRSFKADIAGQSIVYEDNKVQLVGAHDWNEWQTTKESTTTEKGEKTRTCNNNPEHIEIVELPKKGGGSSSSSSSSNSSSNTNELIADSQNGSGNPSTGAATAIFPTALLAAAAMLISKRRK